MMWFQLTTTCMEWLAIRTSCTISVALSLPNSFFTKPATSSGSFRYCNSLLRAFHSLVGILGSRFPSHMSELSTSLPLSSLPAGCRLSVALSCCFWSIACADRCHGSLFVLDSVSTLERCVGRASTLRMLFVAVRRNLCWPVKGATMALWRNRCDCGDVVSSARMHRQRQARQLSMRRRWGVNVWLQEMSKKLQASAGGGVVRTETSREIPNHQQPPEMETPYSNVNPSCITRDPLASRSLDRSRHVTPSQAARKNVAP